MQDCIFCKIANNEIPAARIYETDKVVAFLDIAPAVKQGGHTLVIPKEHYETMADIPEDLFLEIAKVVKLISKALLKFGEGLNIMQNNKEVAGQLVKHFHIHLVPRFKDDGCELGHWKSYSYENDKMQETAEKIKNLLNKMQNS